MDWLIVYGIWYYWEIIVMIRKYEVFGCVFNCFIDVKEYDLSISIVNNVYFIF